MAFETKFILQIFIHSFFNSLTSRMETEVEMWEGQVPMPWGVHLGRSVCVHLGGPQLPISVDNCCYY